MSAEPMEDLRPLPAFDIDIDDDLNEPACAGDDPSLEVDGELPRVVIVTQIAPETVEALLLAAAGGSQEAFVALKSRMAGLVRVNVRRILHDALRSDAATQETFAEVLEDAFHFDPDLDTAATWLLSRAHQHAIDGLRSVDDTNAPQPAGPASNDQSTPVLLA